MTYIKLATRGRPELIADDVDMLYELMMVIMTHQNTNANSQENVVAAQDAQLNAALKSVIAKYTASLNKAAVAELV